MPPVRRRLFARRPIGFRERAFGTKLPKFVERKALERMRGALGWQAAEEKAQKGRVSRGIETEEIVEFPKTAAEERAIMNEKRLEKLLRQRLRPEVAEHLVELVQEAMQQEIGAHEMHTALKNFFARTYQSNSRENIRNVNGWIRAILRVTHPDYAKDLKAE